MDKIYMHLEGWDLMSVVSVVLSVGDHVSQI